MGVIRALEQLKPETLKDESALFYVRNASIYGKMAVLLDVDGPALNKIPAEKGGPFISIR